MTTFQDPQPQSRRAVRQSEREDDQDSATAQSYPTTAAAPDISTPDMWDTQSRRAAQLHQNPVNQSLPNQSPASYDPGPVPGRRAASPSAPLQAEPLTYSTANTGQIQSQRPVAAPVPPAYDPQSFRSRLDARQSQHAPVQQPAAETAPRLPAEQPAAFRVRDFSPESRRAEAVAPAVASPPPLVYPPTDLDYQTEVREGFGGQAAKAAPAPIAQVPSSLAGSLSSPVSRPAPEVTPAPEPNQSLYSDAPGEQTLSRRELRVILAEQQAAALTEVDRVPPTPTMWQPTVPAVEPAAPSAAVAPVFASPVSATPSAPSPAVASPAVASPFGLSAPAPAPAPAPPAPAVPMVAPAQASEAPVPSADATLAPSPVWEATRIPEVVMPAVAPTPLASPALSGALAEFDALATGGSAFTSVPISTPIAPPAFSESEASTGWTPPVGHWSTQIDEEDDFPENTISRRVSSGSTATSALVLPEVPPGSDIRGPLTGTGEIMLTGSINLPIELSSTGASARYDQGGLDSLLEASDHEIITTDSAPVRAISAVSTHSGGHAVTHTQKPKGTRALTALLISASSMAVVAVGLLIAAFVFKIF